MGDEFTADPAIFAG